MEIAHHNGTEPTAHETPKLWKKKVKIKLPSGVILDEAQ